MQNTARGPFIETFKDESIDTNEEQNLIILHESPNK